MLGEFILNIIWCVLTYIDYFSVSIIYDYYIPFSKMAEIRFSRISVGYSGSDISG